MATPSIPDIPCTRPKTLPAIPAVPERTFDRWAIAEVSITGSGIGANITGGYLRFVRYRVLDDGVTTEEDPEGSSGALATAPIGDLYAKAKDPAWPEAQALIDAARAFGERLGREAGVL